MVTCQLIIFLVLCHFFAVYFVLYLLFPPARNLRSSLQELALPFVFTDVRNVDLLERDHFFPSHPRVQ